MPANIFVLGLDDLNLEEFRRMPEFLQYRLHPLLGVEELLGCDDIDIEALLDAARAEIAAFPGRVDGIIGYWDFPVSSMVPILRAELGLPGASLESIMKCEHKYWSRLEQQKVIDAVPRFAVIDPVAAPADIPAGLAYPVWVKPVKSYASELAFRARDAEEFRRAVTTIRERIGRVGGPFERVLSRLALPPEIAAVGGTGCLVEEAIDGLQATVEGYVHAGEVRVIGVVDSHQYPGSSSFLRYQYPSRLPDPVQERMADLSVRVIRQIGLSETGFNIEFFWQPLQDQVTLLEVNPRPSQSHARLFTDVDGLANLGCLVRLAVGRDPEMPFRQGRYPVAAKWFLRRFTDGVVLGTPTPGEIARLEREVPGTTVSVQAAAGVRLSRLRRQDSYSSTLAHVYVGARDEEELTQKYERCVARLRFDIAELGTAELARADLAGAELASADLAGADLADTAGDPGHDGGRSEGALTLDG